MSILNRLAITAVCLAIGVAATAVPAAATADPAISVRDGVTQPVFSYPDAIREYVQVQSPVDSDRDGRNDLIRADIIRPRETARGLRVPVIMHASPYFDVGVGLAQERKEYGPDGTVVKEPLFYDNYFVPRGYAVVSVDMTGTGKSDGCPTAGGAGDVLGVKAVVDWLNGHATATDATGRPVRATWTSGRTGMIATRTTACWPPGSPAPGWAGCARSCRCRRRRPCTRCSARTARCPGSRTRVGADQRGDRP